MGIRFLCSTCGHKLNVKSFLAGKRGVCPQCGIGLDIPLESQVNRDGTAIVGAQPSSNNGAGPRPDVYDSPLKSSPLATSPHPTVPVPTSSPVVPVAMASPVAAVGGASPAAQPTVPVQPATPLPSATPVQHVAHAVPVQPTVPVSQQPVTQQFVQPNVPMQPAVPVQPITPAQPATPTRVDPIDEAPDAIWYVRPQSGGQYGPAKGEVMRKWISEGRVASDSLVWREGWDDWMNANEVFPSLGGSRQPPAPSLAAPNPAAYGYSSPLPTAKPSPSYATRPRKKNSNVVAVTAVVVLGLMAVALLTIFVIVVQK